MTTSHPRWRAATFLLIALLLPGVADASHSSPAVNAASQPGTSSLRRVIAEQEYHASRNDLGLQAPNRAHDLRTYFTSQGIRVHDRGSMTDPALLTLALKRLRGTVEHTGTSNRVEFDSGEALLDFMAATLEGDDADSADRAVNCGSGKTEMNRGN